MKKKSLLFVFAALLILSGCNKMESSDLTAATGEEIGIMAVNGQAVGTRGYSIDPNGVFTEAKSGTIYASPDEVYRTMQISAYQYPKEGESSTYFKGKTFKNPATYPDGQNNPWVNYEDDSHKPIYWPIGSEMDFLAISLTRESKNVDVAWDKENAASKVVLTVPSENTQNDILYASKAGVAPNASGSAVAMQFNHAQAWLEFNLSSNLDDVVTLESIVLEKVHTAGELTITNNRGNALAEWSFTSGAKDVKVDNILDVKELTSVPQHLDMLIPQQPKTTFVIYYTLGEDPQILSYRFTTDQKTWLAGEKYIYNICMNTSEITVEPTIARWTDNIYANNPGVYLNKTNMTLAIDLTKVESETLIAKVFSGDASDENLSWESSNSGVATVDANGKVTPVAEGTAKITVTTSGSSFKATCDVTVTSAYVTIGGKKWAKMNLGATTVAGSLSTCAGDYYQWGSVNTLYESITWDGKTPSVKWKTGKENGFVTGNREYTDNDEILPDANDVVKQKIGEGWRMPTKDDFASLFSACGTTSTYKSFSQLSSANPSRGFYWVSEYQSFIPDYTGVAGLLFVDDSGNRIFFPASGYVSNKNFNSVGTYGYFWSSNLYTSNYNYAYEMYLYSGYTNRQSNMSRYYGLSVRPVSD